MNTVENLHVCPTCGNTMLNAVAVTVEPLPKAEPCLIQSAFLLDNGKRIIVGTSCWTGISSFECDDDWKPFQKPFATCPLNMITGSLTDYHKRIREMHGLDKLVKEHSTVIDW